MSRLMCGNTAGGGEGGIELAKKVVEACEKPSEFKLLYEDNTSIVEKITTTAKEIALSQFNKGSDIIYHAAGGSGLGVFTAAKEAGFMAIGCNSNQNVIDPDHIVASMLKRVDTAAFEIVKSASEGTLKLGEEVVLGLEQGGIGYTLEGSNIKVSEDIVAKLTELEQKIISGEIEVPASF